MLMTIVCGGRAFNDRNRMFTELHRLDKARGPLFIIQGGQVSDDHERGTLHGADYLAKLWAAENGRACATVHAWWDTLGRGAGPIRNGWMLQLQPELVVAFPGGAGTANMVKQARAAGVEVMEIGHGQ